MIDLEGPELSALDKEKINHPNTGALILFARNYHDPEQVSALVKAIRAARKGDILIAVVFVFIVVILPVYYPSIDLWGKWRVRIAKIR